MQQVEGYPQQPKQPDDNNYNNGYHQGVGQPNSMYMMHEQPALSSSTVNLVAESTQESFTCLYVLSILASICFTALPCGLIGLMHIIAARADASRGSHNLAEKKRGQALCWTAWACGLGWGIFVITVIIIAVTASARTRAVSSSTNYIQQ